MRRVAGKKVQQFVIFDICKLLEQLLRPRGCNLIGIGKTDDGYRMKLQRQLGIGADGQRLHFFSGSCHAIRAVHTHQPRKCAFEMLAVLPSVFHQLNAQRVRDTQDIVQIVELVCLIQRTDQSDAV